MGAERRAQAYLFWGVAIAVLAADAASKKAALVELHARGMPHDVVGRVVRFTLELNAGAAFSMSVGDYSRLIFSLAAGIALWILWRLGRDSSPGERMRVLGAALAWGGAAGNLLDRITRGAVVDFIDIGVPDGFRFWTFNIADSAVTVGAILLIFTLWREEHRGTQASQQQVGETSGGRAA